MDVIFQYMEYLKASGLIALGVFLIYLAAMASGITRALLSLLALAAVVFGFYVVIKAVNTTGETPKPIQWKAVQPQMPPAQLPPKNAASQP